MHHLAETCRGVYRMTRRRQGRCVSLCIRYYLVCTWSLTRSRPPPELDSVVCDLAPTLVSPSLPPTHPGKGCRKAPAHHRILFLVLAPTDTPALASHPSALAAPTHIRRPHGRPQRPLEPVGQHYSVWQRGKHCRYRFHRGPMPRGPELKHRLPYSTGDLLGHFRGS